MSASNQEKYRVVCRLLAAAPTAAPSLAPSLTPTAAPSPAPTDVDVPSQGAPNPGVFTSNMSPSQLTSCEPHAEGAHYDVKETCLVRSDANLATKLRHITYDTSNGFEIYPEIFGSIGSECDNALWAKRDKAGLPGPCGFSPLDERTLAYLDLSTASGVTGRKLYLGENYGHLHEQKSCTTFANEGEPFFPMDHTTCFDLDTDEPLRCVDVTTGQNAVSFADYVGGVTNVPKVCQYASISTAKNHFLGWTHQDMMAVNPPASWAMSLPVTYGDNEALSGCITFKSDACSEASGAGEYNYFSVLILRGAETPPPPPTAAPSLAPTAAIVSAPSSHYYVEFPTDPAVLYEAGSTGCNSRTGARILTDTECRAILASGEFDKISGMASTAGPGNWNTSTNDNYGYYFNVAGNAYYPPGCLMQEIADR